MFFEICMGWLRSTPSCSEKNYLIIMMVFPSPSSLNIIFLPSKYHFPSVGTCVYWIIYRIYYLKVYVIKINKNYCPNRRLVFFSSIGSQQFLQSLCLNSHIWGAFLKPLENSHMEFSNKVLNVYGDNCGWPPCILVHSGTKQFKFWMLCNNVMSSL